MDPHLIKSLTITAFRLFVSSYLPAQGLKESFSATGRENWKPDYTLRANMGIFTGGITATGGVRIDENHTLGLMCGGHPHTYCFLFFEPKYFFYKPAKKSYQAYKKFCRDMRCMQKHSTHTEKVTAGFVKPAIIIVS